MYINGQSFYTSPELWKNGENVCGLYNHLTMEDNVLTLTSNFDKVEQIQIKITPELQLYINEILVYVNQIGLLESFNSYVPYRYQGSLNIKVIERKYTWDPKKRMKTKEQIIYDSSK